MQETFRRAAIAFAMLVTGALLGCAGKPTPPPTKPFAGQTLRVSVRSSAARQVFQNAAQVWAGSQGARIEFADSDADVLTFEPHELGRLAAESALVPLPEAITAAGAWSSLARPYRSTLLRWGDTPLALPLLGDATLLLLRADVGAPPKTLAELLDRGRKLSAASGKPCLPSLTTDDDWEREFYTVAAAAGVTPFVPATTSKHATPDPTIAEKFSFHFDTATGEPRIASPGFVAGLQWLIDSQPLRGLERFAGETTRMGFASMADIAGLTRRDGWQVAPPPAGASGEVIPYLGAGGVLAGVRAKSSKAELAFALLRHLSDSTVGLELVHSPAYGCAPYRPSHFGDRPDGWFNFGFSAAATEQFRVSLAAVVEPRPVNAPVRLRLRDEAKYRQVLVEALRKAVQSKADPKVALEDVARKWSAIDERPVQQRLHEYLRSLSLKP